MKYALACCATMMLIGSGIVSPSHAQPDPSGLWTEIDASSIEATPAFDPLPVRFRALRLDKEALEVLLAQAPLERFPEAAAAVTMSLPLPDGTFGRFRVIASPVIGNSSTSGPPGTPTARPAMPRCSGPSLLRTARSGSFPSLLIS